MLGEQGLHLERLLELNRNLNVVYLLKDDLKRLWDCRDRREALCLLSDWIQTSEGSGIKALQEFAGALSSYGYGLLNHCDCPINTCRLESLKNKIKVI